jgi:PAS domain S-box-containing protein
LDVACSILVARSILFGSIKMNLQDRFVFDSGENILFINLAELRIESRDQVDEICRVTARIIEEHGRRSYSIVNYESTEIAPAIMDYYGERIKELYDRYSLTTVRYSSSGFTRSVLRYLGAAKDLESNTFTTREEAIRAIQELKDRSRTGRKVPVHALFDPRQGLLGKLLIGWGLLFVCLFAAYFAGRVWLAAEYQQSFKFAVASAILSLLATAIVSGAILIINVIRPLRQVEEVAARLSIGGIVEPMKVTRNDEVGQLARTINEAALQLQQDIERLSGLYHISLMMGTGTEVSQICELLTRKIARLLDAEVCVILLYNERDGCIHAQVPAYGMEDDVLSSLSFDPNEKSIATWVYQSGEPYLTNDARRDPLLSVKAIGNIREILAVPVKAGQRMLGTIEVINKPGGFLEEEKRLVTIFASQAAHLLQNAQLFEQVRESEERYRQIFESAVDGLYRSTPDGNLVNVNPALAAMLGYEAPEELQGINLMKDLFVDQVEGARQLGRLNESGQIRDLECDLRRRSNDTMPARISIRAVTDGTDNQMYHLGIIKDITEQKRLAQQLIVSERLAVVGELVAGVAHEVRNPLCGITTTLSALNRRLEDREELKPFLDVVMTEVGRLNYLMEQLLEHSRPVRLDGDEAALRNAIAVVLEEFRTQADEKGVTLSMENFEQVPSLRVDRRKMHGVFTNLVENALQHTEPGGRVRLTLSANGTPRSSGCAEVEIEVADTGAGIAAENLSKVFEPFFTTRATGIGLGLAIVRKTIHDHGGTIVVRSIINKGTTFVIKLPPGQG